jgi:hypothetical protein
MAIFLYSDMFCQKNIAPTLLLLFSYQTPVPNFKLATPSCSRFGIRNWKWLARHFATISTTPSSFFGQTSLRVLAPG